MRNINFKIHKRTFYDFARASLIAIVAKGIIQILTELIMAIL